MPAGYALILTGLPRISATTLSFRLMEIACHASYPLKSEKERPPGTFTVYLSCAELARLPKMASHTPIPVIHMSCDSSPHLRHQVTSSDLPRGSIAEPCRRCTPYAVTRSVQPRQ